MKHKGNRRTRLIAIGAFAALVMTAGCGTLMTMIHGGPPRPAESEFGFGPRVSTAGLYAAKLEPKEPLRVRRIQQVKVQVVDSAGRPVDDASITIDGGMPQHGHGLPTVPRVTRALGDGWYQVDGVKFNMGGWWELKFRIASAAGVDSLTFNLDL